MQLRPYQSDLYQRVREAFREHRCVFMQLPTGGGKTAIFSTMARSAKARGNSCWICLPRKELLEQSSQTLTRLGVPHGRIDAKHQESAAFDVHLVSSNTLIRRYDKIKKPPAFIIVDEGHLFYERNLKIKERYPDSKILLTSASPERLDGRGLSEICPVLIEGPGLRELIELDYLVPMRYFAPPIDGLDKIKRRGWEYDAEELAALLERRKVYGEAIEHYERHAKGKRSLVFARSVEEAEKIAHRFSVAGYRFEPVSAKTPDKERTALIDGLRSGALDGVVNCEIATYGLDVPPVECIILLRPTTSKALQCQMVGRGLRVSPETGKTHCTILDHVGLLQEFGHPLEPHTWAFHGKQRRKKSKDDPDLKFRLCPETFMYCTKPTCLDCGNNSTGRKSREEEIVDCELKEAESPVEFRDRPIEVRREYQDRLGAAISEAREAMERGEIAPGPIGQLLKIARNMGRQPMWVYWRLSEGRVSVNVPLLHEIARQCDYKSGWTHFKEKQIAEKLGRKKAG